MVAVCIKFVMSGDDNLPVILVSAVDIATALVIITELINDGSSAPQCNGVESRSSDVDDCSRVWELRNKYYTAAVRLRALPDGAAVGARDDVQAHLIYLTEDEAADAVALCAARAGSGARAGAGAREAVRLLAAPRATAALAAWARAGRYELVPLLPELDPEPEPEPEPRGVERLREALHAHVWPGLRLAGAHSPPDLDAEESSGDSSDGSWGSWRQAGAEEEAGAEARAERFAAALALLPGAGARAGAAGAGEGEGGEDPAARRLRAEQLVAAVCSALGHDLRLDGRGAGAGAGEGQGGAH